MENKTKKNKKIKGGYVLKPRSILNSDIMKAPPYIREIWDWLLLKANHKNTPVCKRGELLTSYNEIREGLAWYVGWRKETYTKWQCEFAMKFLRKTGRITTRKTTRGFLIQIVNYDYYQDPNNYHRTTSATTSTTRVPQTCHTIHNNDNNDNKDNINNKNKFIKNNKLTKASSKEDAEMGSLINKLISEFKEVNPSYKTLYSNKTQRKALERLIKENGYEKTQKAISVLKFTNNEPYAPIITTPLQLEKKLGVLIAFLNKKKKEGYKFAVEKL